MSKFSLFMVKFDGLSLEWQFPVCWQSDCKKGSSKDKEGFVSLVKELKKAFQPKDLILAAGLSGKAKIYPITTNKLNV